MRVLLDEARRARSVLDVGGVWSDQEAAARAEAGVIRVAIAERRLLFAESLAALIDALEGFMVTGVLGEAYPATELGVDCPDIVLVGVDGGGARDTLERVAAVRREVQAAQIVIVADRVESELVCCVLDQALGGLLLTDMPAGDVARSLEQIAYGNTVLPLGWQSVLAANRSHPVQSLSERQREVLVLLAEGSSYEEIAARLFISQNTVKFHIRSIFMRLGVRNRVAAARLLADAIK